MSHNLLFLWVHMIRDSYILRVGGQMENDNSPQSFINTFSVCILRDKTMHNIEFTSPLMISKILPLFKIKTVG